MQRATQFLRNRLNQRATTGNGRVPSATLPPAFPSLLAATLLTLGSACDSLPAAPSTQTPPTTEAPRSEPVRSPRPADPATPEAVGLGRVAFIRSGDVWTKDLPDGTEQRLTTGGGHDTPRWSPSGEWLSFHRSEDAQSAPELWAARRDGSQAHLVAPAPAGPAAWSPTADRLAYPTTSSVIVVDPDGANRVEIPRAADPSWSADGTQLAFVRTEPLPTATANPESGEQPAERRARLWVANADGSEARELTDAAPPPSTGLQLAGWSPDGAYLLARLVPSFSASLAADGTVLEAIPVAGGPAIPLADAVLTHPGFLTWAPDGPRLALVEGAGRATWDQKSIAIATLPDRQSTTDDPGVPSSDRTPPSPLARLSDPDRADVFPAWSPDGAWIAYASAPAASSVTGGEAARTALAARRIWLMQPDGSAKQPLTDDPAYRDEHPQWSADSQSLLFARLHQDTQPQLWLASRDPASSPQLVLDNLDPQALTGAPPEVAPVWLGSHGHLDWSRLYAWWQPRQ